MSTWTWKAGLFQIMKTYLVNNQRDQSFRTKLTNLQKEQLTHFPSHNLNSRVLLHQGPFQMCIRKTQHSISTVQEETKLGHEVQQYFKPMAVRFFGSWIPLRIWWKLQIHSLQKINITKFRIQPRSVTEFSWSPLLPICFDFLFCFVFWLCLTRSHKDRNLKIRGGGARVLPCSQPKWPELTV